MANINNTIKQFLFTFLIRGVETDILQNAPTGWREMIISYARSKTYMGLVRNASGQLDFPGYGAYLLRREYAKYRLFAQILFTIQEDTRQPYNTYQNIYTGKLDFTKKVDKQDAFTVGAKSQDFTTNIDAYDGTPYSISIADNNPINLQIPGIALTEIPQLIFATSPDFRSNAFFSIQIASYQQLSVAPSVQFVGFLQTDTPTFDKLNPNFFFIATTTTKVYFQGSVNTSCNNGSYQFNIYKSDGTLVKTLATSPVVTVDTEFSFSYNFICDVAPDDRLFFYILRVSGTLDSFNGVNMQNGTMFLSYQTLTPPTMCQALSGMQLFGALLQAMNMSTDSAPNLPVTFQSFLLSGDLASIYYTSSDSIRNAQGSIFVAGNTIGPGVYVVIQGSVTYSGNTYNLGQSFGFIATSTMFTGSGVIQKTQSIFAGTVYNVGDSLQAGGTYAVEGVNPDGYVIYNTQIYHIGDIFKYVLGVETFTAVDDTDSMFVKQIAIDPQIITSFADFFQSVKARNGGDAAFGVKQYNALDNTPGELLKQAQGIPFIETLNAVFTGGLPTANIGNMPKDWQSECAVDMMYNTIKVGQKDQQYDAINGALEVSSEQYYSSALLNPISELNLFSPYRSDPYGVELVRVSQNDTAASRSDNDTWEIWINQTPVATTPYEYYAPLGSEGLISISGVDPSYWNWKLSPKHCLYRGTRYLASIFYGMQGQQLILTGAKKNTAMVTIEIDGTRTAESEPVQISNLGLPYFIPEYMSGTIPGGLIDGMPYGEISFAVNGNGYKAFAIDYKTCLATKKPQPIKLLLSPNNNLQFTVR